jgi:hypothetical protein
MVKNKNESASKAVFFLEGCLVFLVGFMLYLTQLLFFFMIVEDGGKW